MPSDYYGESDEASAMPEGHDESTPHADKEGMEDEHDEGGETALIPKSLGAGKPFKAGDEIVLEIVREYEAEYEVRYAKEKKGKDEPKRSQMDESTGAMDKMAKPAMGGY